MARRRTADVALRPTLGPVVCDWIEEYLVHGPGDIQGSPIELDDEFRAFIWRAYELHPRDHPRAGRRVFNRAFFSRPKGRAKSELAGMIGCAEALGPVRLDGWDANGDPVGRPITSPYVRCFATEEGQAGNTFDNAFFMLANGAAYDEYSGLDIGLTRINLPDGGSIVALTSAAASKDGGKSTWSCFDETHLWITAELKRLHATETRNLLKRTIADSWSLETSTMYCPGENSVAEETHNTAKAVDSVLFDHRQAPECNLKDDEQLRAALTYVYGSAAAWTNIDAIIENEFRSPQKLESDNRRYWLNQPVKTELMAVDPGQWKRLHRPDREVPTGEPIVLGFDGSIYNDSTALIAETEDGHQFEVQVWNRPAGAAEDWRVPRAEVHAAVHATFKTWRVLLMFCDPAKWWEEIEGWAGAYGDETVVVFDTNKPARMAPACDRYSTAVAEASMTWAGQSLGAHVLAMARRKVKVNAEENDGRTQYVFVKADTRKIDAGIAGVLAKAAAAAVVWRVPVPQIVSLADYLDD